MTEFSISRDIASGTFDSDKLQDEIISANCVTNLIGITSVGDRLIIDCGGVIDQAVLDSVIHNHVAVSLSDNKADKIITIDDRTDAIIAAGFLFDGNRFSLSIQAQMNWSALFSMQSLISFPIGVTTLDNTTYSLSIGNLIPFIGTGMTVVKTAIGSGRALKIAVNNAADQAALDAVVDTR